tara:strand:+ start:11891 stop:12616 length:726 start_codon:yes stop_codon:yes gene_type:complete
MTKKMTKKKTSWKPSLGTFSKAVDGSIALNFSESGGTNCSTKCEALKKGVCYAIHTEKMKPSIQVSGQRKRELGFVQLCNAYKAKIETLVSKGVEIPWIRFSTFGSVPNRRLSLAEMLAFAEMVRAFPQGVPVHFPVETSHKAERFRAIAVAFQLDIVVRESCQSDKRMHDSTGPCSRIVFGGATKKERLDVAVGMAKRIDGARVCPAIASTILRRPKPVKCGQCTLCSRSDVRVILYPMH